MTSPPSPAEQPGRLGAGRRSGRPVGLAVAGAAGGERRQHDPLELGAMLRGAHHRARAVRGEPVASQHGASRRADLQRAGAETAAALHLGPGQPGRHRVAVAAEGDRGVGADRPGHARPSPDTARPAAPAAARRPPARRRRAGAVTGAPRPGVSWPGAEPVQGGLRLGRGGRGHGPPPPAAHDSAPRTRPRPCGCRAAAGTAPRPPRSASPPGRSSAARRGCPARSPWPAGRCARPAAVPP